jgi:hypothetical protein
MSTLIFGILNIGFGLWKMAAPLLSLAMSKLKLPGNSSIASVTADPGFIALTRFSIWAGEALGVALLAAGIGLLLLQNWARIVSIVYSIIDIVFVPVVSIGMLPFTQRMMEQTPGVPRGMMAGIATMGLVIGIVFGLAYPVLLLFFMTRPKVIEACQPQPPAASV